MFTDDNGVLKLLSFWSVRSVLLHVRSGKTVRDWIQRSGDATRWLQQVVRVGNGKEKPAVAAGPVEDFPRCAIPSLGSARSRRQAAPADCLAQSHSKNLRSCPQPPDSHIAGSGKDSY
ncbi:hypothetical protein Tsp_04613 [Trichinella spiralis]|uniref:hypothetical protein n=1 Tax=Trichinella spiralis TaxID=6334 RepID=UPI0001EFD3BD|nr:hypothetical protein Tsp_04613 [Trichinella spiralis]